MKNSFAFRFTILIATSLIMAACSTSPTKYSGIESSSRMEPTINDKTSRIPFSYSTGVDWSKYSNVILDPVVIYRGPDNQFDGLDEEDKANLAQYMEASFGEKLISKFTMSKSYLPNTLRVKLTLTGANKNTMLVSTILRFDLVGGPYNLVQGIRGKEGMMMGSVSYSVEIYDEATHKLLNAYVTKQYPNAINVKRTIGALSASKAGIDNGAELLISQLSEHN